MILPISLVALGSVAVLGFGLRWRKSVSDSPMTMERATEIAQRTGDLTAIEQAAQGMSEDRVVTAFHWAIKQLWDAYERETAVRLIKEVTETVPDEDIVQFWMRKVLEIEPGLAREYFSEAFLLAYFRPQVAARCGTGGCCSK